MYIDTGFNRRRVDKLLKQDIKDIQDKRSCLSCPSCLDLSPNTPASHGLAGRDPPKWPHAYLRYFQALIKLTPFNSDNISEIKANGFLPEYCSLQ
jgi:hypothetical protein